MAQLTFHNFMDYDDQVQVRGIIVPQEVYRNPQPYEPRPPVQFFVNNVLGIRLVDALAGDIAGLHAANRGVPLTHATRISCRINWPGFDPWNDSLHVNDNHIEPFTLSRLAQAIARTVHKFFTVSSNIKLFRHVKLAATVRQDNMHVRTRERRMDWAVNDIPFESLYLLELRHVSAGSWQPVVSRMVY
ncbi:hypothetical protein NM688_g2032 [Phlebia brevispora]|uniref:Uncharacterized protein n=1 Tax=Phlebia brevispora TaxID=194682 RepID=A0ACC1T9M8_9APHY|nr:hypothetical protein NM688_g2032 [Phlebia brevispora]